MCACVEMPVLRCLYLGTGGLIGWAWQTRETYIQSNRKAGSAIYSLGVGLVCGFPTGMFYSVALPCLLVIAAFEEAKCHYKKKENHE